MIMQKKYMMILMAAALTLVSCGKNDADDLKQEEQSSEAIESNSVDETVTDDEAVPEDESISEDENTSEDESASEDETTSEDVLKAFIDGDTTVLAEGQMEEWLIPDFQNDEYDYEYTLIDLDGDGKEELIIQAVDEPQRFVSVFDEKDGKVVCWFKDDLEWNCFTYPLDNGLMVEEYDYAGSISYWVYRYTEDGETEELTKLFIREELASEDDTSKCPDYQIDDNEISEDKFNEVRKSTIFDHMLDCSDWTKIISE